MLGDPLFAPFDKGANRRRRRIKDADVVLLDYSPEAIVLRKIRRAFVHHDRRARRERSVHRVAMTGHPADIRGAPVDVVFLQIEHPLHRHQRVCKVAADRVYDAFRFAGGARGVERVQRMLRIEFGGRAIFRLRRHDFVPPDVAALAHLDLVADALEHQYFSHRRTLLQRLIDVLLELDDLPAPPSAVRGDADLRFRVVDSIRQRLRRESAEHHRMNRADSRAREHRDRRLRHQRHVDRDAVAVLHAQALQRITASANFVGEHLVGQHARVAGLALPDQRCLVAARSVEMAIEAVVRGIDCAADEPLRMREIPFEGFAERLEPMQIARAVRPEFFRIAGGLAPQLLVLGEALDRRAIAEFRRRRKFPHLAQD